MSHTKLIILAVTAALIAGCGGSRTLPDPDPTDSTYDAAGTDTDGYGSDSTGEGEDVPWDPSDGELTNIIYFDFDKYDLRDEYTEIVARHALQLADNPGTTVRLEGHTDNRGSREYNIGLGERRAQTVRRMLLIQGASTNQVQTVSFGEERAAAFGETEEDHQLNRRVEIKYIN
jgi:peptidoglycan-associated lipoprotein